MEMICAVGALALGIVLGDRGPGWSAVAMVLGLAAVLGTHYRRGAAWSWVWLCIGLWAPPAERPCGGLAELTDGEPWRLEGRVHGMVERVHGRSIVGVDIERAARNERRFAVP